MFILHTVCSILYTVLNLFLNHRKGNSICRTCFGMCTDGNCFDPSDLDNGIPDGTGSGYLGAVGNDANFGSTYQFWQPGYLINSQNNAK